MKIIICFLLVTTMVVGNRLTAQVSINTDGSDANSSAMLDVKSVDKGFLPPRLTSNQMMSITNPPEGLVVYNYDLKTLCWYNGSEWTYDTEFRNCGFLEYEGEVYTTVLIDGQCWMAENLATTKYNDGTSIPLVTGNSAWYALSTPGYCWYGNDSATYASDYGALYNCYTVNTGNLCPEGWHVSTDADWKTLEMFVGLTQAEADTTGWRGATEGGKLKETGTTHWTATSTYVTNITGFTALPGGYRLGDGSYSSLEDYGYWWTTTEYSSSNGWVHGLNSSIDKINRTYADKKVGLSVRCLKD